jgi:hypothetical protein
MQLQPLRKAGLAWRHVMEKRILVASGGKAKEFRTKWIYLKWAVSTPDLLARKIRPSQDSSRVS